MSDLYSTVSQPEIEQAVGKIISLAAYRGSSRTPVVMRGGGQAVEGSPKSKTADPLS